MIISYFIYIFIYAALVTFLLILPNKWLRKMNAQPMELGHPWAVVFLEVWRYPNLLGKRKAVFHSLSPKTFGRKIIALDSFKFDYFMIYVYSQLVVRVGSSHLRPW